MNLFELLFRCIYDPIAFIVMIVVILIMVIINVNVQKKIDKIVKKEKEERNDIKKILEEMPSFESL